MAKGLEGTSPCLGHTRRWPRARGTGSIQQEIPMLCQPGLACLVPLWAAGGQGVRDRTCGSDAALGGSPQPSQQVREVPTALSVARSLRSAPQGHSNN